jgi:predicted AAA+ superfamily ATPase
MDRTAVSKLDAWYERRGRKPLLVRGARQVGKSTLVRLFAAARRLRICELNLERSLRLIPVFSSLAPDTILDAIANETGVDVRGARDTLLFLDEIQAIPEAVQSLRYLHEDKPEIPVIAAGSLLEVALERARFPMPVGRVESLWLGPLTFEEFLLAVNATEELDLLQRFAWGARISAPLHDRLCRRHRDFLFVGGMPEPVVQFAEGAGSEAVAAVQQQLLDGYRDDFAKYASGTAALLLDLTLTQAPALVGRKLKWVSVSREHQSREIKRAAWLLAKAGVIHLVPHTDAGGVPLMAEADPDVVKPLFIDVGLAGRLLGVDRLALGRTAAERLVNEGPLAEQFVGQHLVFQGPSGEGGRPQAFYWLREGRSDNAEVDFVVSHGRGAVPVEVKAGKAGTMKSLVEFVRAKRPKLAVRFDLNPPSRQTVTAGAVRFELRSLPLYLVGRLPDLLG